MARPETLYATCTESSRASFSLAPSRLDVERRGMGHFGAGVTAAPHAYESLDLIGRRLLAVEGQNVSNDAGVTAEERAAVMMRALMGRSAGESIDLTFSCYDDAPAAPAADVAS